MGVGVLLDVGMKIDVWLADLGFGVEWGDDEKLQSEQLEQVQRILCELRCRTGKHLVDHDKVEFVAPSIIGIDVVLVDDRRRKHEKCQPGLFTARFSGATVVIAAAVPIFTDDFASREVEPTSY